MKWFIHISGKEECLDWLVKTLKDQDPTIVKEKNGSFGLYSSSLDDLEEKKVKNKAEDIIKKLNILLNIKSGCKAGITFNSIYYYDEDGKKNVSVLIPLTLNVESSVSAKLSGGKEGDLEADLLKKYLPLIYSNDEFVANAFFYYNIDNHSTFGLYKIYEVIKDDIKDKGYTELYDVKLNQRYCTEKELKSFTNSINSPEGVGREDSRHSSKTNIMSPNLKRMTIVEARSFLDNIFWKWLDDKVESRIKD